MSRYSLAPRAGAPGIYEVAIGWDRPLGTYFVIVFGGPMPAVNRKPCCGAAPPPPKSRSPAMPSHSPPPMPSFPKASRRTLISSPRSVWLAMAEIIAMMFLLRCCNSLRSTACCALAYLRPVVSKVTPVKWTARPASSNVACPCAMTQRTEGDEGPE
jgi:hypothetical protein